jgi:hypothetical protein
MKYDNNTVFTGGVSRNADESNSSSDGRGVEDGAMALLQHAQ